MPASLQHIHSGTPMGATLMADGATFRVWAPNARTVHVVGDFNDRQRTDASLLTRDAQGHWRGFISGARDRQRYMFYVVGEGSEGLKRDPYARELQTPFPSECCLRSADFPWHDCGFVTPMFHDFVIYQLHVGTFFTPNLPAKGGTFLDVARKIPYLAELGVTAIQLMPIQEFQTEFSLGYNGTDYFSPEMDFAVNDAALAPYAEAVNRLLDAKGLPRYRNADLHGETNQLKALVDLAHVHGLAVVFDLVYNHAGGDFGDESLYFFDRQSTDGGHRNSLYFTDKGHAGGLVFDFGKPEVRDFLIQNAKFFLDEYRVDGFRHDQVSVIDHDGAPHGWRFCQDLNSTLHAHRPGSFDKAEYWNVNPYVVKSPPAGAGFDTSLTDGLRIAIRRVISDASAPDERPLDMTGLARSLWPDGFQEHWQFVQGPENHDIVYRDREQRVARLGDPANPRSWYGAQPRAGCDGHQPDGARDSDALHGSGVSRRQAVVGQLRVSQGSAAALGRAGPGRPAHGRSSSIHARVDSAALAAPRVTRTRLPRRACARPESRAGISPLGGGRRTRRDGCHPSRAIQSVRLSHRVSSRR